MHFASSSFLFDLPLCLILLEFTKNERKYAYIEDILSAISFFKRTDKTAQHSEFIYWW